MTKELSKQLCELCGIKPYYGVWVDYGDLDHNYKFETNERKYRLIADYRWMYGVDDKDLRDLKPEFYPDFGKPENFVKLFNLKWYLLDGEYGLIENSLAYYVLFNFGHSSKDWNTTGFIRLLIKALQDKHCPESIKQAIKEVQWSYD